MAIPSLLTPKFLFRLASQAHHFPFQNGGIVSLYLYASPVMRWETDPQTTTLTPAIQEPTPGTTKEFRLMCWAVVEAARSIVWKSQEGRVWAEADRVLGPPENVHSRERKGVWHHSCIDLPSGAKIHWSRYTSLGNVHDITCAWDSLRSSLHLSDVVRLRWWWPFYRQRRRRTLRKKKIYENGILVTVKPANEMLSCFAETKITGHTVEACPEERTLTSSCRRKKSLPSPTPLPLSPQKSRGTKGSGHTQNLHPRTLFKRGRRWFHDMSSSFGNCPRAHSGVHMLDLEACSHTPGFLYTYIFTHTSMQKDLPLLCPSPACNGNIHWRFYYKSHTMKF